MRPEDEVYFFNGGLGGQAGSYAEYAGVQEDYLAFKPKNLSMLEAAALPVPMLTAWEALINRGHLQEGESTLIHARAGGVGHIAIRLAYYLNASVATTISSPEKAQFTQALGAEQTIDYAREDFVEAVINWTDGGGVRLVMDTVGGQTFCKSFAATRFYGGVVSLLSTTCEIAHINTARLRNLNRLRASHRSFLFRSAFGASCANAHT